MLSLALTTANHLLSGENCISFAPSLISSDGASSLCALEVPSLGLSRNNLTWAAVETASILPSDEISADAMDSSP